MGRQEYKRDKKNNFEANSQKNWGGSNNTRLINERAKRKAAAATQAERYSLIQTAIQKGIELGQIRGKTNEDIQAAIDAKK
jgi:hypothetical protein